MQRFERPYEEETEVQEENRDITLYEPLKDTNGNEIGSLIAVIREDLTSEIYMRFFEGATVQTTDVTPQLKAFLNEFIEVFTSEKN